MDETKTQSRKGVSPRAVPKPAPPDPFIFFESAEKEPSQFTMMDIKPERLGNGKLRWEIPRENADRGRRHTFVQQGRIVEVK